MYTNRREKSTHNYLSRCRESIWWDPTLILRKNLSKLKPVGPPSKHEQQLRETPGPQRGVMRDRDGILSFHRSELSSSSPAPCTQHRARDPRTTTRPGKDTKRIQMKEKENRKDNRDRVILAPSSTFSPGHILNNLPKSGNGIWPNNFFLAKNVPRQSGESLISQQMLLHQLESVQQRRNWIYPEKLKPWDS